MNRKIITFIAFILLVLVAVLILLVDRKSTFKAGEADFVLKNPSDIDRIRIENKMNQIVMEKDNGWWRINGKLSARQETVTMFLQALGRIEVISPASKSICDTIFARLEESGTRIMLYTGNKVIKSWVMVYNNRAIPGTYMMDNRKKKPYRVGLTGYKRDDIMGLFSAKETDWKDNILFAYRPADIARVEITYPQQLKQSFCITRDENGELRLNIPDDNSSMDEVDDSTLADYFSYFGPIHYSIPEGLPYDTGWFSKPFAVLKITDQHQDEFQLQAFKIPVPGGQHYDMNKYLAFINNESPPVLLKFTDTDPIMKEYRDFLKK